MQFGGWRCISPLIHKNNEMFEEKRYIFPVELVGSGETPEEAWQDAYEGFMNDPGSYDTYEIEEE